MNTKAKTMERSTWRAKFFTTDVNISGSAPYFEFFGYISFSASIGLSLALSAVLASTLESNIFYAWATALFSMSLTLGLTGQILLSAPRIRERSKSVSFLRTFLAGLAWLALSAVIVAMILIGQGIKSLQHGAGLALQIFTGIPALIGLVAYWTTLAVLDPVVEGVHD